MALATYKDVLLPAMKKRYAVGYFHFFNLETLQAVIKAAAKLKSPVIVGTSESTVKYMGLDNVVSLVRYWDKRTNMPIVLLLDHGHDIELIKKCIRKGYSSVMIDASAESFEENIRQTKRVVRYAHHRHVTVEAELGQLKGVEDNVAAEDSVYTDPEAAKEFVEATGVDALAVSIGTSHGAYKFKGRPKLDIKRLKEIRKKTNVPLVLHGASGVPGWVMNKGRKYGLEMPEAKGVNNISIRRAISAGISKVNIATDIQLAYNSAIREFMAKYPDRYDPRKIFSYAMGDVGKLVEQKIRLFGSVGRGRKHKRKKR